MLAGLDDVEVLTLLQDVLEAERPVRSLFATVACVSVQPERDRLTLCCAGHPPPLLLPAGGAPRSLVDRPGGPPLGVLDGAQWTTTDVELDPGWSLLLFTDGLIEGRRNGSGRLGQEGLLEIVEEVGLPGEDADRAVRDLVARVEELNAGPLRDDLALVFVGTTRLGRRAGPHRDDRKPQAPAPGAVELAADRPRDVAQGGLEPRLDRRDVQLAAAADERVHRVHGRLALALAAGQVRQVAGQGAVDPALG